MTWDFKFSDEFVQNINGNVAKQKAMKPTRGPSKWRK